ncbi:ribonuclease HII [Candidatus Micrarchaeota archaeon]|nr:ribonuclease HII [Candidatus Micrarchaeota archaeon]
MTNIIAGIDEAGRGPVIGPLVVCCASCRREDEKNLKKYASKDSKQLTKNEREEAYAKLRSFCTFRWLEISAADLNVMMKTASLNDIEARTMAELIKRIGECDIMIDMPDRYSWTFRGRMEAFGIKNKKFEAEHKADENYPIVAAASICAKIIRDNKIEEIKKATCDFGSGYPSDPKTRAALMDKEKIKILEPFIRSKWKTLERLMQKKLFEDDEGDQSQDSQ